MKKNRLKIAIGTVVILILLFIGYGYISSLTGWYGYKKWQHRVASIDVDESKQRKVLVQILNYKMSNSDMRVPNFTPFIEKGFRYGLHTSKETRPLEKSDYPYQLSFNYRPTEEMTILIGKSELQKFDSTNLSWGYLRMPLLKDTIFLDVYQFGKNIGSIAVWQ
jgi:hypothetical protein